MNGRTPEPLAPYGTTAGDEDPAADRLLAGWRETGRPADLAGHLRQHGPPPVAARAGSTTAADLADAVEAAGLTGRGGAGFPTARKLRAVAAARGRALVVVNAMESEPASRKDQFLLAVAPHLVLDGAVIAASAVGADTVHVCLPRLRHAQFQRLGAAVEERVHARLDPVRVRLHALPHAYVSSESTALARWLGGGPARPRGSTPHLHDHGVAGRPTLLHNAETLAHLALVARYGPAWFRQAGTPGEPGTTLVTVSGAVTAPAVLEVALGTPIDTVLDRAGGPTEPLQAVLIGGFAGTWLPAEHLPTPFTRHDLAPLGAAPGAGVLVALPASACGPRETARMLSYLAAQGARQCGPCRFGLPAVAGDFTTLAAGRADPELASRLHRRTALLPERGACRHPDGAARLAASALRTFAGDVGRHLTRGACPAAHRPPRIPVPPATPPETWR
ncbi:MULTISPECIES: NADH-ubiquinone oxidoreductase-F iron-sulfur binding region domain-containing protein [unclassified Streptomyces]|uniref:NADH-ubiquinone oxidoreductase-F iron-sulfur binding region domain-containing protein n=1 Tax=unclassified Streptomyces TaxID=2593676 RepID=UPI001F04025E|nr:MULTISPECIES: NADH-ubiquinone oxidoreductase-F iron-sulfur binding region domain-containing protein [unclassified Streptomyces]MCH0562325.1 SLBB domain-containing protein [Streptomyces sp. MUM 2J]MCH0572914.1 SLBB domain-containing protein [Streptomyces sp. MUM 136J]